MMNFEKHTKVILILIFISLIAISAISFGIIIKNYTSSERFEERLVQSLNNFKNITYESSTSGAISISSRVSDEQSNELSFLANGVTNPKNEGFSDTKVSFALKVQGYEAFFDTLRVDGLEYILINEIPEDLIKSFAPNINYVVNKWIEINKNEIVTLLKKYTLISEADANVINLSSDDDTKAVLEALIDTLNSNTVFHKIKSSKIKGGTEYDVKLNVDALASILFDIYLNDTSSQEEREAYKSFLDTLETFLIATNYSLIFIIDENNTLNSVALEYNSEIDNGYSISIIFDISVNVLSEPVEIKSPETLTPLNDIFENIIKGSIIESFIKTTSDEATAN